MIHRAPSITLQVLVLSASLALGPRPGSGQPVPSPQAPPAQAPEVRNVILMITDGGGVGTWTLARLARGDALAVARMPVVGLVDTRNSDGGLTDSAAGATAYATGVRTFHQAISVAPECRELIRRNPAEIDRDPASCAPLETLLERAEASGRSTGLVTTTYLIDATPAAFAAHAPNRYLRAPIARQMIASGTDVMLGGGRSYFDGSAGTGAGDLLAEACATADCPPDATSLEVLPVRDRRLIGLFATRDMERAGARSPDLPTMTRAALDRLGRDPDGFFLLVETEGTDSEQHDEESLDVVTNEILEFDRAVAVALDFATRTPGTLVVVTADHETGGLAIHGEDEGPDVDIAYTTGDHTHNMVPLFAMGPGAERFAGIRDNDEVGRLLRGLLLGPDEGP
jgi:alkaline phosphatase